MVILIVLVVLIILIFWFIAAHNGLMVLKNKAEEAWSTIDVYLKQRYDLIPNLVETVKGYAKHESETLENVVKARNAAMGAGSIEDKVAAENQLQGTLKTLFALSESYPDLKANDQFIKLQGELTRVETDLVQARKYYNGNVRELNTKIAMIPTSIVASLMKLTARPYFELDSQEERKNVTVKF